MNYPTLFVTSGRQAGEKFEVSKSVIRLGRGSGNDVHLIDGEASRYHAEIRINKQSVQIVDLSSANGTFLNQQRIRFAQLSTGDELQLGQTKFLFTNLPQDNAYANQRPLVVISQDEPSGVTKTKAIDGPDTSASSQNLLQEIEEDAPFAPLVVAEAEAGLNVICDTIALIQKTSDETELLEKILTHVFNLTSADRGAVLLASQGTNDLRPALTINRRTKGKNDDRIVISETIISHVVQQRQGVLTTNAIADKRWKATDSMLESGVRNAICVPLLGRHHLLGLIYVDTYHNIDSGDSDRDIMFGMTQLNIAVAIGQQAAMAIEYSRYYSALLEKERLAAIGQLAANLSHSIKNMMQGIESGSYLVRSGLESDDMNIMKKGWDIVSTHQQEISKTFLNVLSFSRSREPLLMPTDYLMLLEKLQMFGDNLAVHCGVQIKFNVQFDELGSKVLIDEQGVYHCLVNLLANAIDACREIIEPLIIVTVKAERNWISTWISDNGEGIPTEKQHMVFNEFFTTKGQKGTGIGLMTAKKIIEEQGGTITFESDSNGTRFCVALPRQK